MFRFLSIIALLAWSLPALAQTGTPVKQSGNVTPAHASCWTTNGIIQDCGTAAVPFLTSIGTVGQGQTICAWTALSTAPGSQKLCFGVFDNSAATITLQNFGIDTPQSLNFVLNGVTYPFPFTVGGIVGPNSSTVGDIAVWNNTTGSLLKDVSPSGVLDESCGTNNYDLVRISGTWGCGVYNIPNGTQLYASAAGSDSGNTCTNSGSPCTLYGACVMRAALATFFQSVSGSIRLNIADGTYNTATNGVLCSIQGNSGGSSNILTNIVGNTGTPANVVLAAPAGDTAIFTKDIGETEINGVTITGGNNSIGVSGGQYSVVDALGIVWGSWGTGGIHYNFSGNSTINISGETLNANISTHINLDSARATFGASSVNIPAGIVFASNFISAAGESSINANASTFTGAGIAGTTGGQGSLIGPGYLANGGTKCASFFPGNGGCAIRLGFMSDGNDLQTTNELLKSALEGTALSIVNGGTGAATLPTGALKGNGTSAITQAACADLSNAGTACVQNYTAGTWTPTITTDATTGTPAYTTQSGTYEQIGRQITARFNITLSGWTGSPTGNVEISGLPVADVGNYGTCTISFYSGMNLTAAVNGMTGLISDTASLIVLYQTGNTAAAKVVAATNFGTTGTVIGSCNYHS